MSVDRFDSCPQTRTQSDRRERERERERRRERKRGRVMRADTQTLTIRERRRTRGHPKPPVRNSTRNTGYANSEPRARSARLISRRAHPGSSRTRWALSSTDSPAISWAYDKTSYVPYTNAWRGDERRATIPCFGFFCQTFEDFSGRWRPSSSTCFPIGQIGLRYASLAKTE